MILAEFRIKCSKWILGLLNIEIFQDTAYPIFEEYRVISRWQVNDFEFFFSQPKVDRVESNRSANGGHARSYQAWRRRGGGKTKLEKRIRVSNLRTVYKAVNKNYVNFTDKILRSMSSSYGAFLLELTKNVQSRETFIFVTSSQKYITCARFTVFSVFLSGKTAHFFCFWEAFFFSSFLRALRMRAAIFCCSLHPQITILAN